jgi:hypothetical protein
MEDERTKLFGFTFNYILCIEFVKLTQRKRRMFNFRRYPTNF